MQTAKRCGLTKIYIPHLRGPVRAKIEALKQTNPQWAEHYGFMHNVEAWRREVQGQVFLGEEGWDGTV